ncbi:MAG: hypothetical protein LBB29_03795 [Holosporaceae bacterium]|jgi:hypothetical protein|nr:hypothetical protein [Holosporaceae bacterium]
MKKIFSVFYGALLILLTVSITDVFSMQLTEEEKTKKLEAMHPDNWNSLSSKDQREWTRKALKELEAQKEEKHEEEETQKKEEAEGPKDGADADKAKDNKLEENSAENKKSTTTSTENKETSESDELKELKKCKCVKRYIELSSKHAYINFGNRDWVAFFTGIAMEEELYLKRRFRKGRHRFDA